MTTTQLSYWLARTAESIANQASRGSCDTERDYRLNDLIGRHDVLRQRAKEIGVWNYICDQHGWGYDHDGFDCAA